MIGIVKRQATVMIGLFAFCSILVAAWSTRAAEGPETVSPALPTVDAVSTAAGTLDVVEQDGLRAVPRRLKDYHLPGLDTRVSLKSFDPWDVVQLIDFLAYRGGLSNIVIAKGVAGLTTKLKFEDVSVGDALEIVLSLNNLAYEIKNGIITIMTDQEYTTLYGTSFYDSKQVQMVELKYADPVHVAAMLAPLKSAIGTVVSDPVTGTLILIDTPGRIREMKSVIEKADLPTVSRVMPTETRAFVLKYAEVDKIQGQIAGILSREAGTIRTDTRTQTLIITDLPHNMRKIESVIASFDVPNPQVFIEAKIVNVLLEDDYKMGINWNHMFDGLAPRVSIASAVQRTAEAAPGSGVGTLTYKTIFAGGDLSIVLDALKSVGETRILSNPHVAAMSGEEATIKVVREEPYAEATLEVGTTNVVGESIKFIEVGVKLGVTPRINGDGFISMVIKPEISEVIREYQAFRAVPVVQRSFAETSVTVRDGETLIIGGMIQNKKIISNARVPFLGSIPLIGVMFRSKSEMFHTEETVVFLTPRLITGDKPVLLMRDTEKPAKPMRPVGHEKADAK